MITATATVGGSIGVVAQLMSIQTASCPVVTEQVNGVTVGTTPSGGVNNQLNQDTAGNQVGTGANPSVVANSTAVNSDGSYSLSILAEGSNVISDTPILANGSLIINQPSTIAKDVVVRYLNGTLVGSVVGSEVLIPNPVAAPTLTIGVFSNIGLTVPIVAGNLGQTVYVKATPTGITPTSYTFSFDGSTDLVVTQAGDVYTWVINSVGAVAITARATDGAGATANATVFSFTSSVVIDKQLRFDGVNDFAVTGLPKIQSNVAWSVSFRFKMASTAGRTALYSFANSNGNGRSPHEMYYESNAFIFLGWTENFTFAKTLPWTGDTNEHVFAVRYSAASGVVEIFIDGVSLGTIGYIGIAGGFWSLVMGRAYNFNSYGNVRIADLRVFKEYITLPNVATLQSAGSPVGTEVLWYPFASESIGEIDLCTDIITGYQLALYNITSPNGIVAYP